MTKIAIPRNNERYNLNYWLVYGLSSGIMVIGRGIFVYGINDLSDVLINVEKTNMVVVRETYFERSLGNNMATSFRRAGKVAKNKSSLWKPSCWWLKACNKKILFRSK